MSRRVSLRCAAVACIVLAVLALGSCEFPGFLRDSFDIEAPLYWDNDGTLTAYGEKDGVVTFSMSSSGAPIDLFFGTLTDGTVRVHLGAPDAAVLESWTEIMPITPTLSDSSALGCVINTISSDAFSDWINYRNQAATTFIYWIYSDRKVDLSAAGPTTGPGGVSVNMSMDLELREGWNLIILQRTGTSEPYTNTYTIGDLPEDVYLIWEGAPK